MPVVDVDPDELRYLTGHSEKDDDELKSDLFDLGLEFEGWTEDDEFQLEFAPDRLDRLSVEGVARSLRYHYGDDRGVEIPNTNSADWTIEVEDQPDERPYVTGAIVRGLDMDEAALESLIQLQEKLHATMGRKRAKGAIGVHDLTMLKGDSVTDETGKSITYTSADPDEATFVPLDADAEMTPSEVMASHETGQTYGDLVADFDRVPAIYDAIGLFSFPPVINGRRTEVSVDSRDLFIEMTGTDQWTIDHMCNIVCYALAARGGQVEKVDVSYADDAPESTPARRWNGRTSPSGRRRSRTTASSPSSASRWIAARSSTTPSALASTRARLNLTTVWHTTLRSHRTASMSSTRWTSSTTSAGRSDSTASNRLTPTCRRSAVGMNGLGLRTPPATLWSGWASRIC